MFTLLHAYNSSSIWYVENSFLLYVFPLNINTPNKAFHVWFDMFNTFDILIKLRVVYRIRLNNAYIRRDRVKIVGIVPIACRYITHSPV